MVYFFIGQETKLVKIGSTEDSTFDKRLTNLQIGSPDILRCIAFRLDWTQKHEFVIHEKFKHLRQHGEWFKLDHDLIDFIDNLENEIINPNSEDYFIKKYNKICIDCSKEFITPYKNQSYCDINCRVSYWKKRGIAANT